MSKKFDRSMLSANFKRDYVAVTAVLIFFFIIAAEIVLAFSIPLYLQRENAMARQIQRQRMTLDFDYTRAFASRIVPKSVASTLEIRLIRWNMDKLAYYLRDHSAELTSEEIAHLHKSIQVMSRALYQLANGKPHSVEAKLQTSAYLDALLEKELIKNGK